MYFTIIVLLYGAMDMRRHSFHVLECTMPASFHGGKQKNLDLYFFFWYPEATVEEIAVTVPVCYLLSQLEWTTWRNYLQCNVDRYCSKVPSVAALLYLLDSLAEFALVCLYIAPNCIYRMHFILFIYLIIQEICNKNSYKGQRSNRCTLYGSHRV